MSTETMILKEEHRDINPGQGGGASGIKPGGGGGSIKPDTGIGDAGSSGYDGGSDELKN